MSKAFKYLKTHRLVIRPLRLADAVSYHESELASVQDMAPYWSWVKKDKFLFEVETFLKNAEICHQEDKPSAMYFGVFLRQNHVFTGCIWYAGSNWFVPKFEIGYWQDSRLGGLGYMTEAVNVLTQATFSLHHAKRVDIKIFVNNIKSRMLAERLGFKLEAIMQNNFRDFTTHELIDGAMYACCDVNQLPKIDFSYG